MFVELQPDLKYKRHHTAFHCLLQEETFAFNEQPTKMY